MIPEEKKDAVTRGLREAFGAAEFEDIGMVTTGRTTSLVFRIVVQGSAHVLKIITRGTDEARHFSAMKSAAEAGLAPRVRYASVEDRIFLSDFVEAVPFAAADALVRMPATLRALHALPRFAGVPHHINTTWMFLIHEGPARDAFLERVRTAHLLPNGGAQELFDCCEQLSGVYRLLEPDMVSSHNDLFKPDNILFDGARVWLVDWEAAFLNDRYADLAVVANLLVTNEADERAYLQEYFGRPPNAYEQARFFLAQQLAHTFYAMAFLLPGSANPTENAPEFTDFPGRFWAGEIRLVDPPTKSAYGLFHWQQLRENLRRPRFEEAVRIVSSRRAAER